MCGLIKQAAGLRQLKATGRPRAGAVFWLHVVAYNLIRLANLLSPWRCWHEPGATKRSADRRRLAGGLDASPLIGPAFISLLDSHMDPDVHGRYFSGRLSITLIRLSSISEVPNPESY